MQVLALGLEKMVVQILTNHSLVILAFFFTASLELIVEIFSSST